MSGTYTLSGVQNEDSIDLMKYSGADTEVYIIGYFLHIGNKLLIFFLSREISLVQKCLTCTNISLFPCNRSDIQDVMSRSRSASLASLEYYRTDNTAYQVSGSGGGWGIQRGRPSQHRSMAIRTIDCLTI